MFLATIFSLLAFWMSGIATGLVFAGEAAGAAVPEIEVETNLKTSHYEVKVSNCSRVEEALNQARPWKSGEPFDAMTTWKVDWTYCGLRDASLCKLKSGKVTVSILITVPRIVFPKNAPSELKQTWRTYLRDLYEHEEGHARIATKAVAGVKQELLTLGSFDSLEELDAAVTDAGNRIIDRCLEKEREYDRTTGHGTHQSLASRAQFSR